MEAPAARALRLGPDVDQALRAHAERAWPEECCGALLGDRASVFVALPLENTAGDRRRGFLVSARDSLRVEAEAEARGLRWVGVYHSHPDAPAVPSAADGSTAWPDGWTVIIPVRAGVAGDPRAYWFDADLGRFTAAPAATLQAVHFER